MALEGIQILQQGFQDLGQGMQKYGEQSKLAKGADALMQENPGDFYGGEEGRTAAAMAYRTGNTNAGVAYQNQDSMEMRMTKLADGIATEMTKPEGERDNGKIAKMQQAFGALGNFYKAINMYRDYSKLVAASMRKGGGGSGGNVPGKTGKDGEPVGDAGNRQYKQVGDKAYIYSGLEDYPEKPGFFSGTSATEYAAQVAAVDERNKKKIAEKMNDIMQFYPPETREFSYKILMDEYDSNKGSGINNYVKTIKETKNTKLVAPVITYTEKSKKGWKKSDWSPGSYETLKKTVEEGPSNQIPTNKKSSEEDQAKSDLSPYYNPNKKTKKTENVVKQAALSDEDRQALDWVKKNPNTPEAAGIKQALKAKGIKVQ